MSTFFSRFSTITKVLTVFVVLALVVAVVFVFAEDNTKRTLRVDFTSTNSLYKGSDVRILGVPVGTVEELKAQGDHVEATISYEGDIRLPADVKAVVISPAIVGDRFVQLAPAYSGGPVLPDNAELGVDRTAVPVELDEIYSSLDDLSTALGPEGANKDGALSSLIEDSARQLDGQGEQLNETLKNFGQLSQTLSNNKDDLFSSVREVNEFVGLLNRNDNAVRAFFDSTAEVSEVLEGERDDLAKTLEKLSAALIDVRRLVKDNRGALRSNVDNLQRIARVLGNHEDDIERILVDGPTALSNVAVTYNGDFGTLDNRADINELVAGLVGDPSGALGVICSILGEPAPPAGQVCQGLKDLLGPVLENLHLPGLGGGAKKDAAPEPPTVDNVQGSLQDMLGGGE